MDTLTQLQTNSKRTPLFFAAKDSPTMKKNEHCSDKLLQQITAIEVNDWEQNVVVAPQQSPGQNK